MGLSQYRLISKTGGRFPSWVFDLKGKSGVYVIRNRIFDAVMYVGESHSDKLYGTLTRHFQAWKGVGSGSTYPSFNSEVAVEVLPPAKALERQVELIGRLKPLDNGRLVSA